MDSDVATDTVCEEAKEDLLSEEPAAVEQEESEDLVPENSANLDEPCEELEDQELQSPDSEVQKEDIEGESGNEEQEENGGEESENGEQEEKVQEELEDMVEEENVNEEIEDTVQAENVKEESENMDLPNVDSDVTNDEKDLEVSQYRRLRSRRALMLFNDIPLKSRRALMP